MPGFGNHGFKNRQTARPDETATDLALRIHNHGGWQCATVEPSTDLVVFIEQNGIIDTTRLDRTDNLVANLLQYRHGGFGIVRIQLLAGSLAADLTVQGLKNAGKDLTLDSFIKGMEAIKDSQDIFGGPKVTFGPNIRQGANSSFVAEVKDGKWVRLTQPLGF